MLYGYDGVVRERQRKVFRSCLDHWFQHARLWTSRSIFATVQSGFPAMPNGHHCRGRFADGISASRWSCIWETSCAIPAIPAIVVDVSSSCVASGWCFPSRLMCDTEATLFLDVRATLKTAFVHMRERKKETVIDIFPWTQGNIRHLFVIFLASMRDAEIWFERDSTKESPS